MYIFMGKTIYMADSRYVAENPHGIIDNERNPFATTPPSSSYLIFLK